MEMENRIDYSMEYDMEELFPVVGELVQKYTAFESASIPYEKAEQLMGAVLYCIRESAEEEGVAARGAGAGMSAKQAYKAGLERVDKKVRSALTLYNEMLPEFISYGSHYLYDTFVKGIPEFFKWYDSRFEPQNTILTLDYPVLKDLSGLAGIDRIYEFIRCICLEQKFLRIFPKERVITLLLQNNAMYRDTPDNICEPLFLFLIRRMLSENFRENACRKRLDQDVPDFIKEQTEMFLKAGQSYDPALAQYLFGAIGDILVRLEKREAGMVMEEYD